MFEIQCKKGIVRGSDGECYFYDYKGRPRISILIMGDKTGKWIRGDGFLLDSGADTTILHSEEAEKLGLDIRRWNRESFFKGVARLPKPLSYPLYYKDGILIKIGHFLPVPLTIGFSPYVEEGTRILGRRTIFDLFGIAFNGKEIGIFTKRRI